MILDGFIMMFAGMAIVGIGLYVMIVAINISAAVIARYFPDKDKHVLAAVEMEAVAAAAGFHKNQIKPRD